ncbi:hypothetical protein EV378_3839 [Pseudonocardia endophytica]|uniref:Uncharacterized protein n=1 Tax=Pseudonocardia endophytica TaxID=401976 RepID=A0A4R1HHI0_PSEEN|nr:hypothetical protein EV378_3839 [Pseudonocardia endophytica]
MPVTELTAEREDVEVYDAEDETNIVRGLD